MRRRALRARAAAPPGIIEMIRHRIVLWQDVKRELRQDFEGWLLDVKLAYERKRVT